MSKLESIDHQIERLLDAFDGAQEETLKLSVVEHGLAHVEARLWLADIKEAAIFCVELERLRAHLASESSSDAFKLFSSNLKRLSELGTEGFSSKLLDAVNEMRSVRGAMRFERATTLAQAERTLWREMHRRTNIPRRLRRHISTVIDLLEASGDASKSQRALPLLGREAEALKTLFRFNPSNLVWGSLHSLCLLAHDAQSTISLATLRDYCERQSRPSDQAKSLVGAMPCLAEIAAQIERHDAEHPLPGLLKTPLNEMAAGVAASTEEVAEDSEEVAARVADTAPVVMESGVPLARESSSSRMMDVLPVEAKNLSDAAENLSSQIAAGLLEETPLLKDMQTLAKRVLNRVQERGEDVGHHVGSLEHLCELMDLAASGVNLPESEFESLAADLEGYISGAKALNQIDDALTALKTLRDRIATRPGKRLETNLEEQEFEDLLARVTRIQDVEQENEEDSRTRFFGYLLTRGGLKYALPHREDMRIESVGASERDGQDKEREQYSIEEMFPQSQMLATPKQRLSFAEARRRLGLACDEIRGPDWIDLVRPLNTEYGFTRLADGESLCVLSPQLLLSHCR